MLFIIIVIILDLLFQTFWTYNVKIFHIPRQQSPDSISRYPVNLPKHDEPLTIDSDAAEDKATNLAATDTLRSVAKIITWSMFTAEAYHTHPQWYSRPMPGPPFRTTTLSHICCQPFLCRWCHINGTQERRSCSTPTNYRECTICLTSRCRSDMCQSIRFSVLV